jgi:hypothetical protein
MSRGLAWVPKSGEVMPGRKKVTNSQIVGAQGVNLLESIILRMGFTWHPSNQSLEAGVDGWAELRDPNTHEVKNSWLAIQSRARTDIDDAGPSFKYHCKQKDLDYWMQGSAPVILVVSRPNDNKAWWVSVKDYFRNKDYSTERAIIFDVERDLLTASTAEDWKDLNGRYGAGTYFTPSRRQEKLTSNLLRVIRFGSTVYSASTPYSSGKEVREQLKAVDEYPPWEWAYSDKKRIYSFHDLNALPWSRACDVATITSHDTDSLAFSDDRQTKKAFVRLLNESLKALLRPWHMKYSDEGDCYYFTPSPKDIVRDIRYKSRKKITRRRVVKVYTHKDDQTRVRYYRHDAMQHRFLRFGDAWYLMIEPTYVFTSDGENASLYREELLAGIKTFEGDAAISGTIVMFADLLKDRDTLFEKPHEFLGFGQIESCELDAGIDDEAWARIKQTHREQSKPRKVEKSAFGAGIFD